MKTGAQLIADERKRQVKQEGWTAEHDDSHDQQELAAAATMYASPYPIKAKSLITGRYEADVWPWDEDSYKPSAGDRIRELVKAGALIAAEIDRLQRLARRGMEQEKP